MALPTAAAEVATTLQTASLNRHPSPAHDMNPSTAASQKQPVTLASPSSPAPADAAAEDEIPLSALRPLPRRPDRSSSSSRNRPALPPLPDLRFEQSYLRSIERAPGAWGVAGITVRDQVFLPLAQGLLWTLLLDAWRHWNAASRLSGASLGARIRRWWWGVNGWALPESRASGQRSERAWNASRKGG